MVVDSTPKVSSLSSHSTWCVMRSGGEKEFGSEVRVRPRSMDVALLFKRETGSPILLPSNEKDGLSLEKRGKFSVLKRHRSLEKMDRSRHDRQVGGKENTLDYCIF